MKKTGKTSRQTKRPACLQCRKGEDIKGLPSLPESIQTRFPEARHQLLWNAIVLMGRARRLKYCDKHRAQHYHAFSQKCHAVMAEFASSVVRLSSLTSGESTALHRDYEQWVDDVSQWAYRHVAGRSLPSELDKRRFFDRQWPLERRLGAAVDRQQRDYERAISALSSYLGAAASYAGDARTQGAGKIVIDLSLFGKSGSRHLLHDLVEDFTRKGIKIRSKRHGEYQPTKLKRVLKKHDLVCIAKAIRRVRSVVGTYKLDLPSNRIDLKIPKT